jgi:hypothetical protein
MHYEYPKTLAAAKKAKGAEWALADALLEEVGPRGSDAAFRDCQEYLAEHGIEYTVTYLTGLHSVARNFPPPDRSSWLAPGTATHAGSPEVVEAAVEIKKAKAEEQGIEYTPPTQRELQKARRTVTHHAQVSRGRVMPQPKRPTIEQKRAAAKAPVSDLRRAADVLGLHATAMKGAQQGRRFITDIAGRDLDEVERDDLVAEVQKTLDVWRTALAAVRNPLAAQVERFLEEAT